MIMENCITSDLELLEYQKEGVDQIEKFKGTCLLADTMGLGKTIQTLVALKRNPEWLPALIVVPASVKYSWEYESQHHVGLRASVCEGQTPPVFNRNNFSLQSPITIINFDILKYWIPYLKKLKFKTLVVDEGQYIKNPKAARSKATKAMSLLTEQKMVLSGTPLTESPKDLWPILNLLWPKTYNSFWSFAQQFCDPKLTRFGWDYSGAANLPELHAQLKRRGMIRRRKEDVLKDLPPKMRRVVPIQLNNYEEYREARDNFIGWLRKNNASKVHSAKRCEALVKVGYLLRLTAKLKMRSVVERTNQFFEETDQKLITFAVHKKAIEALKNKVNVPSVVIDGSVKGRQRQLAVDQFQKDPKTRFFIGQIKAAGVGLTLTASSTVDFAEMWWNPASHLQAEDRPHRIGQLSPVTINFLVATGTIEERLCKILQKRQEYLSSVLDGGSMPSDLNIYTELLRSLEEEEVENGC